MASLNTIQAEVFSNAGVSRGTITRILSFSMKSSINKIGSVEFTLALDDTQSIDLINENDFIVLNASVVNATVTNIVVGRMVASEPRNIMNNDGSGFYLVAGPCWLYELTRRNMGFTIVSDGSGGKDAGAPGTIIAVSDKTWGTTGFNTNDAGAYIVSSGESVFDAYVNNEKQAGNFLSLITSIATAPEPYFGVARWGFGHPNASFAVGIGIRFAALNLIDGADSSVFTESPILDLEVITESNQLVTRIHTYGAGQGDDRLTLENATDTPPAGFTVDTANSIITNTTLEAVTNQPIIERVQHFSSIKSEDPADATANTTAANELQQAAISWLREHDGSSSTFYRVKTIVRNQYVVGQLVTLTHTRTSPYDAAGAEIDTDVVSINGTFYLLEYNITFDGDGNLEATCLLGDAPKPTPGGDKVMAKRVKDLETVVRHTNGGQSVNQPTTPSAQDASFVLIANTTSLPNDRALTAGDGIDLVDAGAGSTVTLSVDVTDLLGDGLTETANNFVLGTPSSNAVATSNAVTASSHTHAITSSSDVTAASILASDANGRLGLEGIGIGTAASTDDITVADDVWIGLGAAAGRIVFDNQATDQIEILDADVFIGAQTADSSLISGGSLQVIDGNAAISSETGVSAVLGLYHYHATAPQTSVQCRTARGTRASPTATQTDDVLARFGGGGHDGSNFSSESRGYLQVNATAAYTASSQPSRLGFFTTPSGSTTEVERYRISAAGDHFWYLDTEDLRIDDAGSTSATEQDWIEVQVGGVTGYIRVYASK